MPNRIIKESLLTSEKVANLTDFQFRLWIGLILLADDLGHGDARPEIIKGRLFPFNEDMRSAKIKDGVCQLETCGCISLYEVDGKQYYSFENWGDHQRIRNVKPKYPQPNKEKQSAAICRNLPQSAATCKNLRPESEYESEYIKNNNARAREGYVNYAELPLEDLISDPILADAVRNWIGYKEAKGQPYVLQSFQALISEVKAKAKKYGIEATIEIINTSMGSGYDGIIWNKLEKQETNKKQSGKTKNQFNNFEQHDYDFAEIERQILG